MVRARRGGRASAGLSDLLALDAGGVSKAAAHDPKVQAWLDRTRGGGRAALNGGVRVLPVRGPAGGTSCLPDHRGRLGIQTSGRRPSPLRRSGRLR